MNRRTMLATMLIAPYGAAAPPVDALLIGDSLSGQLGWRLGREALDRNKRLLYKYRAGSSVKMWAKGKWLEKELTRHPPRILLICLGVNATKSQRPTLVQDMRSFLMQAGHTPVLWIAPNREGYRFDLTYLHRALSDVNIDVFWAPKLPLESDRVHFTDAGNRTLAKLVADRLWGT